MGQWRLRGAKNTESELIQYKVDDTDNKDWLPIWAEARTNGVPHDIEESHNRLPFFNNDFKDRDHHRLSHRD